MYRARKNDEIYYQALYTPKSVLWLPCIKKLTILIPTVMK